MSITNRLAIVAAIATKTVNAYSSYLDDCEEFAALFSATCGGVYTEDYAYDSGT